MIVSEKIRLWVWLSEVLGPCNSRLRGMLAQFGSLESIYERRETAEMALFLAPKEYRRARTLLLDESDRILEFCERNGIYVIGYNDDDYPARLRDSIIPPSVIYVAGEVASLKNISIAGVGSRHSTQYGRDAVRYICEPLAAAGITLVSGMASGIDTEVHKAALNQNGTTIAVLGTGIDITYPARQTELRSIIEQNGAVVSEYPPFAHNAPYMFALRNRIISGLAKAVIIFEAAKKSGTMITAGWALDDGRDVFAVPGGILSSQSEGTNRLIKQGAIPALSAADVLETMGLERLSVVTSSLSEPAALKLSGLEKAIYDILKGGEKSLDALVDDLKRSSSELLSALTMLELDGVVASAPGQRYHIVV